MRLKPDPLGITDILSGILVFFTQTFVPEPIIHIHTAILLLKGGGTIGNIRMPFPVYVIGNMADVLSAAILYTGKPPVLQSYKGWIATILLLKGLWGLFGLMQKF